MHQLTGDIRQYLQTDDANLFRQWWTNGIMNSFTNSLQVTALASPNMSVNVGTGGCLIDGYWMYSNAVVNLPIAPNTSGNPRIDRVIVTIDEVNARAIQITVLAGIPAVSPVPPTLTQNTGTTFQLSLAQVAVASCTNQILAGNITDERWTRYCGVMAATMGKFSVQTDGSLNGGGMNIHNIADPVSAQDAATMHYVTNLMGSNQTRVKISTLTSGTSFTIQASTQYVDIILVGGCGGGGGGGGGYSGGTWAAGGGGGGGTGACLQEYGIPVSGNIPYTIAIGMAGTGGSGGGVNSAGGAGGSGGSTSITINGITYIAGGGGGGGAGSPAGSNRAGGASSGGGGGGVSGGSTVLGILGSSGVGGSAGSGAYPGGGGGGCYGFYSATCYGGSGGSGGGPGGGGNAGSAGTAGFMIIVEWS